MNPKSSPALKVALLVAVVFGIFALSEPSRILGSVMLALTVHLPCSYLTQCIKQLVLESQLPHKTVNLFFQFVSVNNTP